MLSQQLAQGTSPALPRPASAAGALLPGTAPCGQTNGLAVDQRGAGCGRPGTYRRGICRAKNGSGATRSLPAPRGTAGTWGHLHSLVVGWVRACAGEGEGLQAVSEGMLSPCPALAQSGCELWDGTTLKARQRPFVLVRRNSAAPKPGLGALGAPGAARQLGAAQHSAAQPSETPGPGNVSASKYCSSFSLSGEIKKKREPSFLECNLPPATRSHVN